MSGEGGYEAGFIKKFFLWGCGSVIGLVLVSIGFGYYYYYHVSQFNWTLNNLPPSQTVQVDYKGGGSYEIQPHIDTGASVSVEEFQLGSTENKLTVQLKFPFLTDRFRTNGELLKPLIESSKVELRSSKNSTLPLVTAITMDRTARVARHVTGPLTVKFNIGTDIGSLEGLTGNVKLKKPLTVKQYDLPMEKGKFDLQLNDDRFKLQLDGENIYFPSLSAVGKTIYVEALNSSNEIISSSAISNHPKTFQDERSFLQFLMGIFNNEESLNITLETKPNALRFYQLVKADTERFRYNLSWETERKTVQSFDTEIVEPIRQTTLQSEPLAQVDPYLGKQFSNQADTSLYEWKFHMIERMNGDLSAKFFDQKDKPLSIRGRSHSWSTGDSITYSYRFEEQPSRAELWFLFTSKSNVSRIQ